MSDTLSYGYKLPEAGDIASSWMSDLEDDIQRLNDHDHDGVDSSLLTPASITKFTTTITALSWTDDGGGNYSKVITVPAAILEFNNYYVWFYITATGVRINPDVERVTATTYRIRTNEQLALTATYI